MALTMKIKIYIMDYKYIQRIAMTTISIAQLQKNISIITNANEPIELVDKRKNKKVAIIYPLKERGSIARLAGKYSKKAKRSISYKEAREKALSKAWSEKYGLSD